LAGSFRCASNGRQHDAQDVYHVGRGRLMPKLPSAKSNLVRERRHRALNSTTTPVKGATRTPVRLCQRRPVTADPASVCAKYIYCGPGKTAAEAHQQKTHAVTFSPARTMNRFLSGCASVIQIVRPWQSIAEMLCKLRKIKQTFHGRVGS
jgi:hypothetical protein